MTETPKINRRKFIKNITGVAAGMMMFPTIIPAAARGKNGHIAPSDRITMGFIGVGGMGTANLRGFLEKSMAQVVAVCDVDRAHCEAARDLVNLKYQNSDCATYSHFGELLERQDIDAVCISVPDHWHAIAGILAARAGKDIYAEKPLAYTISEGRAIVDAVNKFGTVWQTGSQQRSEQNFRFACELVRNGRIGEVNLVHVGLPYGNSIRQDKTKPSPAPEGFDYEMWLGPAPWVPYSPARCHWNFRWISDYSGGQITDWAGHHIDIAHWGMDTELTAPLEIEGTGVFPKAEDGLFDTCESYRFECKYQKGFTLVVADNRQHNMGVRFMGTEGWIFVDRGKIDAEPKSLLKSIIQPHEIHLYRSDDHRQNFLDCVKTRKKTVAPAEVAHRSIMVGHLGIIAIKLKRKLRWNPDREEFVADLQADRFLTRSMSSPWHTEIVKLWR